MPQKYQGGRPLSVRISKIDLLGQLSQIDADEESRRRVLRLETDFRQRIQNHLAALPLTHANLKKFKTSPFVLLFQTFHKRYTKISEIEADILPAKLFSSMETSAGKMVEKVMLPEYEWECVESEMNSPNSALDGKQLDSDVLRLTTLKSGPQCLNDTMVGDLAHEICANFGAWAADAGVQKIDFTYGVLYGTRRRSNKKDWHILRRVCETVSDHVTRSPLNRWDCAFSKDGVDVDVTVRIGGDWWGHVGGSNCLIEMCIALIRACVQVAEPDANDHAYTIADLGEVVSTDSVPGDFNVGLLQRSQLGWLFLIVWHFCDELVT